MATTISDFKEMELSEIIRLYQAIHKSFGNRTPLTNEHPHDIPTLNIMRQIIILKVNGTLYNEYNELVAELGEGDFESVNSQTLSRSEYYFFKRNKKSLGITEDIRHNSELYDDLKTVDFLEEQETKEETKEYVESDIMEERKEFLYTKMLTQKLTQLELMELKQLNNG
jgi:hypothetical protein